MNVDLDRDEWQRIINVLMSAPWNIANPLLVKITQQLDRTNSGNSQEVPVPQPHLESKSAH